ncbi:LPS translocon maturation chaperone LptM [SAR92 clade bacterium H246]|jgi:predicted small lipoprotein YifL
MLRQLTQFFLTAVLLGGLISCGNTGDLYLPQDETATQQSNTENTESQ